MIILHTGFDGLDIAFKCKPSLELVELLERAKAKATETQIDTPVMFNGVFMNVAASGGVGGYAFRFDTGPEGAVWFVKKPKASDPWGVRVSCKSRPLALRGLEFVRADLDDTRARLGMNVPADGVSIGRVDYAIDILHPEFVLDPKNFVVSARTKIATHADLSDQQTGGRSGRFTSVTVGKMPGRQVIVYDKREEVMNKGKLEWPFIWNAALAKINLPALDMTDPSKSRVWRVELRLGKKALKEKGGIRGWSSFYESLQPQMLELVEKAVNLKRPKADTNRHRWNADPVWTVVRDLVEDGMFSETIEIDEEALHEAELREKQLQFLGLAASHLVTLSVLEGMSKEDFSEFLDSAPARIEHFLEMHKRGLGDRMRDAADKYRDLLKAPSLTASS